MKQLKQYAVEINGRVVGHANALSALEAIRFYMPIPRSLPPEFDSNNRVTAKEEGSVDEVVDSSAFVG